MRTRLGRSDTLECRHRDKDWPIPLPLLIRDPSSTTRDRPPFHIFTAHQLNELIVPAMFRTYDHETRFDEMSHKTTAIVPLSKNNRNLTTEPIRRNSPVIETKTRSQCGD
jgi:hypothetical protein